MNATFDEINARNGRRPFVPFWVKLEDGQTINVIEPNTAVVTHRHFSYTPDRQKMVHVPLGRIRGCGNATTAHAP